MTSHPQGSIGLLEQYRLLLAATRDQKLSRADIAVLAEIVDSFKKDKGDAWCSYAHLASVAGTSERNVSRSVNRLREQGWLTVTRRGNRGLLSVGNGNFAKTVTAFVPNFDYLTSASCNSLPDIAVRYSADNLTSASGNELDDQTSPSPYSSLPHRLTKPADGKGEEVIETPAVATPPPRPDHSAGSAVPAALEGVALALGVKVDAKAVKAWQATAPDEALVDVILEGAKRHGAKYNEQEASGARHPGYRKALSNWLTEALWLEDAPRPYRPARKQTPQSKPARIVALASPTVPDEDIDSDTDWIRELVDLERG